ncbi:MAG: hypothetical protein ABIT05_05665 [Chitinophagaceae bacterium]
MKKLQLSFLLSLAVLTASSQKVYFVYVQSESDQPFFVKMKEKVYSSSGSGYIILSKLLDSTYNFSIGFPQGKWPEQNFSVAINKKDHGYLLKNFGEKGWGLFDLQTLGVQMAVSGHAGADEKQKTENKDVSPFTDILSKAADDPSLKEKPVLPKVEEKKTEVAIQEIPKKEEPKTESKPVVTKPVVVTETAVVKKEEPKPETKEPVAIQPAVVTETAVVKKEPETKTEPKETVAISKPVEVVEQPVVKKEAPKVTEETVLTKEEPVKAVINETKETELPYRSSQIRKMSASPIADGLGLVFIDTYPNGMQDTVSLVIPNPMPAVTAVNEEPKPVIEEKKFIENISVDSSSHTVPAVVNTYKILSSPPIGSSGINSNCKEIAAESDFFKLRKTMASGKNDEEMLGSAKKYFKTKCFSTTQVKNLSTLFLNDEAKYRFFDLANGRLTDMYNFPALAGELRDEYYINRFRAMIRN